MNVSAVFVVLALLCVSLCITGTDGLKCYHCNRCNDPFAGSANNTIISSDCKGSCAKGKFSGIVVRTCFDKITADSCVKGTTDGIAGEFCICSKDLCNSSAIPEMSFAVLAGIFVVLYMLK